MSFSVQLNFTDDYRHQCFNVTIVDDDISEKIENFHVQLVAYSPSSSPSIDLLPRIATVHIVDNDGIKLYVLWCRKHGCTGIIMCCCTLELELDV